MANNYSQMSIAFPVTEEQGVWLETAWKAMDTFDTFEPAPLPEGLTLEDVYYSPCNLQIEEKESERTAWLYSDENVDAELLGNALQQFLKHFDLDQGIGIEVAMTCSKPRIGEFGGFAIWVTKDSFEAWSTNGWLAEREKVHARNKVIAGIREGEVKKPFDEREWLGREALPVTCDNCSAVSESGWGDTPLCVDCQRKTDPSLVCEVHQLTRERDEPCPACRASGELDARIDELHGPGAAAALNEAIADGTIFGELEAKEDVEPDIEHILTDEGCKISVNGQGHLPCSEHVHYIHKLNAYTGFGRRGECGETHPVLSAAQDWEPVTCPDCLKRKPADV